MYKGLMWMYAKFFVLDYKEVIILYKSQNHISFLPAYINHILLENVPCFKITFTILVLQGQSTVTNNIYKCVK